MDNGQHCRLCENRVYDIKTGTKCSLTDAIPSFNEKCEHIKFDKKLEAAIKEMNIEIESIEQTKTLSYANLWFFLTVSILLFLGGYIYGSMIMDHGVISTVPLIIMGAGLLTLPMAFGPVNKYRSHIKVARNKKSNLDDIIALYGVSYTVEVITHKDINGNKEYEANVKYKL